MTDTRGSFEKVIEVLTNYNKWRRGEDESITQPAPKDIGEAIEAAIAHLSTTEARDGGLPAIGSVADRLVYYADRIVIAEPHLHKGAKFTKWAYGIAEDMRKDAILLSAEGK